ncbi:hypothetical protein L9F63_004605 [Diploptera punctata]|uniref:Uncharacterized protein n=1 Tax=Diploptera punctata TaxID=6984 RepID=A0AAD7ZFS0_DIPPU|nr:hypothetical protein L9F63_004605 [Diploptera punctata]
MDVTLGHRIFTFESYLRTGRLMGGVCRSMRPVCVCVCVYVCVCVCVCVWINIIAWTIHN